MDLEAWKLSHKLLMCMVFNIIQKGNLTLDILHGYYGTIFSSRYHFQAALSTAL